MVPLPNILSNREKDRMRGLYDQGALSPNDVAETMGRAIKDELNVIWLTLGPQPLDRVSQTVDQAVAEVREALGGKR